MDYNSYELMECLSTSVKLAHALNIEAVASSSCCLVVLTPLNKSFSQSR